MNYITNHDFINELQTMTQAFYPNEKFTRVDEIVGTTAVSELDGNICKSKLYRDGRQVSEYNLPFRPAEVKNAVKKSMFRCMSAETGYLPDWGILTGIRPSKLIHELWARGYSNARIIRHMSEELFVQERKARLCIDVAENEKEIIRPGGCSVYIGIPFCPSRCLYCSFTSYPLDKYSAGDYLDALEKEINAFAGTPSDSLYIGGGTPTSLSASQLDRLLTRIGSAFPKISREYTIEAGRPDTLDREKLGILKTHGVTRLSINPQTMSDATLTAIGRKHSVVRFIEAFEEARNTGHGNINVDLILGLPGEKPADIRNNIEKVLQLSPESLTVHVLAVKRASKLKETMSEYSLTSAADIRRMLETAQELTLEAGLRPYYMYRQKNMLGNFENVGYAKNGMGCVYNVQIMAERQNILALGAGGVTKIVDPATGRIDRIFNVKSVDDYMTRINEMIQRKLKGVVTWAI